MLPAPVSTTYQWSFVDLTPLISRKDLKSRMNSLFDWKGLINDMKTLVIYTSQTGFTKRYAEWISEELNADIYDLKDVKKKTNDFFETYEAIIYAGWCMAGMVVKVKWFFERAAYWKNKKLSIVAVGASPNDNPEVDEFLNNLFTDEQRPFIKAGTIIKRYACSCLRYVEGYGHFFVARNIFD